MKHLSTLTLLLAFLATHAQTDPEFQHWWYNTDGHTFNGILTDVEGVWYTDDHFYVKSSGIPSYFENYTGSSLFEPADMQWSFEIPRNPEEESGTHYALLSEGQIAVLLSGHVAMSPGDGQSWMNNDEWHSLAYEHEGLDFDAGGGHSTPGSIYHNHVDPSDLHDFISTEHSPLIGYAFDGYPIYGPFGYSDPNDAGSNIARMTPSWQERNITARTTLPDGTASSGPPINNQNPLGSYWEDYEYIANSGDLDEHNGRWCTTPDYPDGTYAYFITVDASQTPVFPYICGESFYGKYDGTNSGMGGHVTVPGTAAEIDPSTLGGNDGDPQGVAHMATAPWRVYPNPTSDFIVLIGVNESNSPMRIFDASGRLMMETAISSGQLLDIRTFSPGVYVVELQQNNYRTVQRFIAQ